MISLAVYCNSFALLTQANWRWRNDDGSETAATWKANENAEPILSTTGEVWRLRIQVYNASANPASPSLYDTLQYTTDTTGTASGGGLWTNITDTADSNPFQIAGTSAYVTQNQATTAQLSSVGAYSFIPGRIMVDSMVVDSVPDMPNQTITEIEWAIVAKSNILTSTRYFFRMNGNTGVPASGMTYPSLVTAGLLPIRLSNFGAMLDNKRVKLTWTASSQFASDKFEILRSSDARNWTTIATLNAQEGGNTTVSYVQYDNDPMSGINYYRVKQTDIDGHTYMSEIKSLKLSAFAASLTVFPNPAHGGINFSIMNKNDATNVKVTLATINGSVIHQEAFNRIPANTTNQLHLKNMPPPGVYILRLSGDGGLSQSTSLIVQ